MRRTSRLAELVQRTAAESSTPADRCRGLARVLYMKSVSVAEARQSLSALIAEVESFDEHVLITKNGRPTAVIISADEWEAIEDTAFWRSVPGIADDIQAAGAEPGVSLDEFLSERRPPSR
jgi:antitoxin YefM